MSAEPTAVESGLPRLADLHADSQPEFCALLVWVRDGSGLSYGQLNIKTGIARSQLHSLTRPDRPVFPTMPDQVKLLACACGLGALEVARLLELWHTLRPATWNGSRGRA